MHTESSRLCKRMIKMNTNKLFWEFQKASISSPFTLRRNFSDRPLFFALQTDNIESGWKKYSFEKCFNLWVWVCLKCERYGYETSIQQQQKEWAKKNGEQNLTENHQRKLNRFESKKMKGNGKTVFILPRHQKSMILDQKQHLTEFPQFQKQNPFHK